MRDKSLSLFLSVLFVISSITILTLTWLRPMPGSERILSTLIGSAGILVVIIRALLFKKTNTGQVAVEANIEDKS